MTEAPEKGSKALLNEITGKGKKGKAAAESETQEIPVKAEAAPAPAVAPVKAMIRSLDLSALREMMAGLLAKPPADIRLALTDWARAKKIEIA